MKTIFDLPDPYTAMSPIHIPRGFTKRYLAGDVVEDMEGPILAAQRFFADHDIWLIEGTGHAGVGAVVGLSNARVASMLRAPTVIISEGGVGRPIDEIVLNASHFEAHGVPVAGAIVNKIRVDESPGIEKTLERGLALHGIPLLGVLPYRPILSSPTLDMVLRGVKGRVICPGPGPGPGDRRGRDRRDGTEPHAGAHRSRHARDRARGPRGRDPDAGRRPPAGLGARSRHRAPRDARGRDARGDRRGSRGQGAGHRPHRGLRAAAGGPRRDPPRQPVHGHRRRGHLHRGVGGPRPSRQDAPGGRRQDRAHQGAGLGAPARWTASSRSPPRRGSTDERPARRRRGARRRRPHRRSHRRHDPSRRRCRRRRDPCRPPAVDRALVGRVRVPVRGHRGVDGVRGRVLRGDGHRHRRHRRAGGGSSDRRDPRLAGVGPRRGPAGRHACCRTWWRPSGRRWPPWVSPWRPGCPGWRWRS